MALLRTTTSGSLTKYIAPLIEQIENSMKTGSSISWNKQNIQILNSKENRDVLDNFLKLGVKKTTEKKAYALELKSTLGRSVSIGSFEKPKAKAVGNRGDIAEGIIGAAIAARFVNKNQTITVQHVKDVLSSVNPKKAAGGKKGFISDILLPSVNENNYVIDHVRFYLSLAEVNMKGLLDTTNWTALDGLFKSGVKYANGNTVSAWSKLLYENNQENLIEVLSDGLGNQTGTKVDVSVKVDGEKTNINISLKAGDVKQFGQVGGSGFDKQVELWDTLAKIDVTSLEKDFYKLLGDKKIEEALYLTYNHAAKVINRQLSIPISSKKFIENLGSGIQHFATLREENVTLVQMNKSEAKVYKFDGVAEALSSLNLECVIKDSSGKPKMLIQDKKRGPLLEIRVKQENKPNGYYIRNYVEKGKLMGELIAHYE